jgi:hypothetical protein
VDSARVDQAAYMDIPVSAHHMLPNKKYNPLVPPHQQTEDL